MTTATSTRAPIRIMRKNVPAAEEMVRSSISKAFTSELLPALRPVLRFSAAVRDLAAEETSDAELGANIRALIAAEPVARSAR